ncbi:biotin/lipoyl-binding protein, partial [Yoonia sp.]|uniref:biotin/lipoyl-binding protein n=1 Tax=Yoonia sp. TaxID=2212373 RepID=UPI003A4D388F
LFASDMRLMTWSDELRLIVRQHLAKDRTTLDLLRADLSMGGLDGALLNDMAGSDMIRLDLPGKTGGLGLILFDPKGLPDDLGAMVQALGTLAMGRKPPMAARRKYLRAGLAVAGLALAVWLVLPAPLVVTATAVSEPRGAVAMALPVPGFVDAVQVRVGDRVMAGDPIARFRAPDLEEQIAALGIELTMEQVVAQTALSTNDYGAFLLSQQKIESATQRQARLQDRLAQLDMRADVAGRVVSAMGPDSTGRFVPMGETIAILQPEASFAVGLTVSRVDAPLLTRGQQGQVWFRGLSNRSWAIETETPVVLQNMGGNGEDQLTLQARVLDVDQQALFAGLAGFARIEVGQQVRARVLSRYATEWVRGKAWIWFGLTF